jgi:hypothetical protein
VDRRRIDDHLHVRRTRVFIVGLAATLTLAGCGGAGRHATTVTKTGNVASALIQLHAATPGPAACALVIWLHDTSRQAPHTTVPAWVLRAFRKPCRK